MGRGAVSMALLLLVAFASSGLRAQEAEEYRMEIGGALGTDFYLGDVGSTPFRKPSVVGGVVWRRNFNPRMVLKANALMAQLRGESGQRFVPADATTPGAEGGAPAHVAFKRSVIDAGAQFELNLLGYGFGLDYQDVRRVAPYITAGVGFTLATGHGGGTAFGLNIPVGAGVKYKLRPRVNVGMEWTVRFSTSDALDKNAGQASLSHPFGIKSSGFKNKDAYSFLMVFLTYDISAKCKACHNND